VNITPYKGRDPYDATIVFVYRNLHHDVWSLMAKDGKHAGLVVGHSTHVVLDQAKWRVNEAGRQRVIQEQRKNVHAGVSGQLADDEHPYAMWERVSYNPYKAGRFVLSDLPNASRVDSSRFAMFDMAGKAWVA